MRERCGSWLAERRPCGDCVAREGPNSGWAKLGCDLYFAALGDEVFFEALGLLMTSSHGYLENLVEEGLEGGDGGQSQ